MSDDVYERLAVICTPVPVLAGDEAPGAGMQGPVGFVAAGRLAVVVDAEAGRTRTMEDAFIAPSGTDVTDAFRLYLRPLLGSGMPDAYRLRPNTVAKVLKP
jgi:hypothetical protein